MLFCLLQFVQDGVFYAELNELLTRELAEDGYSGVEVRVTPMRTEIIIRATRTQNVLGEDPNWLFDAGMVDFDMDGGQGQVSKLVVSKLGWAAAVGARIQTQCLRAWEACTTAWS